MISGGVVRTAEELDYEMRSSYVITVQATDMAEQGSQPRSVHHQHTLLLLTYMYL